MSLREERIEQEAELPGGGSVLVRVGIPDDPYIDPSQSETVTAEILAGENPLAAVNTVLDPDQEEEARELAQEIVAGLESGDLPPSAAAIEPLALRPR